MLRMVLIVLGIFLFQGRAGAVSVDTEEGLKAELQKEEGDNVIEISKNMEISGDLGKAGRPSLTIDGGGNLIDGKSHAGFSVGKGQDFSLLNTDMQNFSALFGGAVNNQGKMETVNGDFSANSAKGSGGVIYNTGEIGQINGSFEQNFADKSGGAVYNNGGTIEEIEGTFVENKAGDKGGAVANVKVLFKQGNIASVNGTFDGNSAEAGGAIYNNATLGSVAGTFSGNRAAAEYDTAQGGAIANEGQIDFVSGTFSGNVAQGAYQAQGGAIYHKGKGNGENAEALVLKNASFYGNRAVSAPGKAFGGAVYGNAVKITADGGNSIFAGNYANDENNAVYVAGGYLELSAQNKGKVQMDDGIDGESYNLKVLGDGTGEVVLNNLVNGVNRFNLTSGSVTHLGKNAVVNVQDYIADNATLQIDMAVDAANQSVQNGVINVADDVQGSTTLIVNAENPDTYEGALTAFLNAQNDDLATMSDFNVGRVVGSPYMWDAVRNAQGEEDGSTWYLALSDRENPDYTDPNPNPSRPIYAPEIAAYTGMQQAALEQNRSISGSVERGLSSEKSMACYEESCGMAELIPQKKVWFDATYESAELDSPADMEADIKGMTAGADFYNDGTHRVGVFGAYRNGKYDFSGKGDYYAELGSQIQSESWLGGAYYKFGRNNWKLLTTLYAGKQDMDVKTDDRLAFASTDAMQYGASAELAKKFAVARYLNVEPSLGLRYTMLDIDDLTDNVGKTASFDTLQYLEAELGIKLEYLFCNAGCTNRLYAKPSVIRTFSNGGKTQIAGIDGDIRSYKDRTLGRMEVGGEFGITPALSGYAAAGYTFGDEYSAYDLNAGLNYAF